MSYKITLDGIVLDVAYQDAGPWRAYELYTFGNTELEAIANASISEIDQDGGELATYGINAAPMDVDIAAARLITRQFNKGGL